MIKTKSIYDPKSKDDGIRVLVTRYWPRGIKKEEKDYWFRDLGPDVELIRKWKAGEVAWDKFKKSYKDEYRSEAKKELLGELKKIIKEARGKDVTLLCTCRQGEHCHRDLLKEMVKG